MKLHEDQYDGDTMRPVPFDDDRHDQDFRRAISDAFGMCCPECHVPVKVRGLCASCNEKIMEEIERDRLRHNHN